MPRNPKPKKEHKMKLGWKRFRQSICQQPGCQFFGKQAEQGHCHTLNDDLTTKYIKSATKSGVDALSEVKALRKVNKMESAAAWIKALEAAYICHWANDRFTLDELVCLRAENAKLKNRLCKAKEKGE